jgi:hypothetical protein
LAAANGLVLLLAGAGAISNFTLESPLTYVVLALTDLYSLALMPMQWIRVDYVDEKGDAGRAYFTVASAVGRWAGGLRQLQQHLMNWIGAG